MKSRMLTEMMSGISLVLFTIMPNTSFGQMGGTGGMDGGGGYGMATGSEDAITRPSLSYTVDDKPYRATRVRSFRYMYQSFRPKELAYVNSYGAMGGGMGMGAGYGSMGSGSETPGGYGGGGGYLGGASGYPGGIGGGGYGSEGGPSVGSSGYNTSNSDQASERLTIKIHAYLFDSERVNDRTRIELMIEQPNEMGMEGMSGGFSEGGMGASDMSMSDDPLRMKPLTSLGTPKTKPSAKLSQSEIKLVTDIICQTIWKADVVKALFASKGQGESAADNENFLKQLLAEQYDTQLARQELEAESIKRRLELLVDELKRRKLAKDRVVDVQLGRLILDAQGLLNSDR